MKRRTLIARSAAIALYLGLGALAVLSGRRHSVYFNNYAIGLVESRETASPAIVTVEGMKPLRVRPNGMRVANVGSGSYSFRVEYEDGRPAFTGRFRVPFLVDAAVIPVSGLTALSEVAVIPVIDRVSER